MAFKPFFLSLFIVSLFADTGFIEPWGKDSDMIVKKSTYSTPEKRYDPASKLGENLILFHQNVLSPVDGPRSHFRPTSSRYMLLALRRYGFIKGYIKGCDRLIRENNDPWVYRTQEIGSVKYKWDPTY